MLRSIKQYLAREMKFILFGVILVLMFSLVSFAIFDLSNSLGDRKLALAIRLHSNR